MCGVCVVWWCVCVCVERVCVCVCVCVWRVCVESVWCVWCVESVCVCVCVESARAWHALNPNTTTIDTHNYTIRLNCMYTIEKLYLSYNGSRRNKVGNDLPILVGSKGILLARE